MRKYLFLFLLPLHLTLTSVVFEFVKNAHLANFANPHLTLTSVVFEFADGKSCTEVFRNLTLTSVVFEYSQK